MLLANERQNTLDLRNPWGQQHLWGLPMADFERFFGNFAIGPAL